MVLNALRKVLEDVQPDSVAVASGSDGACEGTLACSTCHLIFEEHIFEKLEAVTDEENDMLDLAYGLTDRSRLGCQIYLTKAMDNMTVRVPDAVADARQAVDASKNS
uniref:Ferredoxin 1 n=1 Tax=Mustela putorius furo TaxID=9669 RepID=M3XW62_MUSPF